MDRNLLRRDYRHPSIVRSDASGYFWLGS